MADALSFCSRTRVNQPPVKPKGGPAKELSRYKAAKPKGEVWTNNSRNGHLHRTMGLAIVETMIAIMMMISVITILITNTATF